MTMQNDYKVIDLPSLLARDVRVQSASNEGEWIRDEHWYLQIREIYKTLLEFLVKNRLLKEPMLDFSDSLVIFYTDLNEDGKAFINSGADERWLNRFDNPGIAQAPTDTSILQNALMELRRTH